MIRLEYQDAYTLIAPKWLSAKEYASEVRRFEQDTGWKVYFEQDLLDDDSYPESPC